jgi:hypothetical protein
MSMTPSMPAAICGSRRVCHSPDRGAVTVAGMLGSATAWPMKAATARTVAAMKTPRQPMCAPRKAPSGAAAIVATAPPPKMIDSAVAKFRFGTKRNASEADRPQKPPTATPRTSRAASSGIRLGATATARLDTICAADSHSSTRRRSTPPMTGAMTRLVTIATIAGAVTV